ncbi:tetratricopeptide repeat protein [Sungkyunkwania multivorans]|uniref:Tetratricopeptide repeat protein n=1 Tax=Sungkyunkwania multivorans TaxID=1173618 RepID=A0ABW3CTA8_9FLAO
MNHNRILALAVTLVFSFQSIAQQSKIYTHDLKDFSKALELYNNKQYQAARTLFAKVKENTSDQETEASCTYYIANAAIRLNQLGADRLMEDFVEKYPTSTQRNNAFMDVADYYFANGKYSYALKWYTRAGDSNLSYKDRERYNFNMGYVLFVSKKYNQAETYFNKVNDSPEYGAQAKYYIGYIAYEDDNYDKANEQFDQVAGEERYKEKLAYFQADMNFKSGNFEKAIELALDYLPKANRKEISEINKIIGESYFNLEKYSEAIPYLKEYKGKRGRWNNTDFYQLGYAYYKQQDYENAIQQFNKIVGGDNTVAQNAYYHLAECYLNLDKKQEALNAFRNASQMAFEPRITEDAWLNYAKLSYDIGNPYESVPSVLTAYLEKYPDSGYRQEIEELLIDSYITSKNYEAALEVLQRNNSYSNKAAFQKVAFYRGLELFNEGRYQEAENYFDRSLEEQIDPIFTARATYWKAECDYTMNDFDEALVGFKQYAQSDAMSETTENVNLNYNLAYTYFKLKKYDEAITYFNKFIQQNKEDKIRLNDSYLRLGDSHFVNSKYWPAMEAYNKAIAMKGIDADYAAFQKAISYGFVNRNDTKIEELNRFVTKFPKSTLRDDAFYELGNAYVKANNDEKGIESYDRLVNEYRMSSYVSKALLRQGLIHYNAGSNELALTKFKTVVRDFPNTSEAVQSVATARLIYVDTGRVDEYAAWVKSLDFVEVSDTDLDNDSYEAAQKQYDQGRTDAAIRAFESYIEQFPNGLHSLKANFYLAELYFGKGEKERTTRHYSFVINKERNEFTEQALARLSQVWLESGNYDRAIPLLQRLETEADFPQNITFAQSNLMKAFYQTRDYQQAVAYADKVLENAKIDNRIKSDAQIIIARSAIKTGDEEKAKQAYKEVQKIATGPLAAEALYYDTYFKHKEGNYKASNTAAQKLAKNYGSYRELGAKGLVVMAKNFYALDDAFQATYILESVTKNFTDYPEIVAEAQAELRKIKQEEAKRNSSVDPNEGN